MNDYHITLIFLLANERSLANLEELAVVEVQYIDLTL